MNKNSKIKLDKTDLKILAELDQNCRIPSTILAKKVLKSRQAVEYRIEQLVQKRIITSFNAAINPHRMGCKLFKVYMRLRNIPAEKEKLFAYLKSSGLVYWMGECSGSWDLIFAVFARNDYQFYEFKNKLISKFSSLIIEEDGEALIDVKQYSKMYFTQEIHAPILFGGEVRQPEMDEIDYKLLSQIVNEARLPINELARRINSTPIIIRGRLKKLEEKGIIIQYRLGINLNLLGKELYKAIIRIDRYTKEDENKLFTYLSNLPQIQYLIRNIWQIELEFVVNNFQEYYQLMENLKKEFCYVIRTVESVLMITDQWTPGFGNLLISKPF